MSYELGFWRQQRGIKLDPRKTYELLSNGETVDGLEELPIDNILDKVRRSLTGDWMQMDAESWEAPNRSCRVFTTPQFVRADCNDMDGEEMNIFIEIGLEFGCPLYDPQNGERYD